MVSLQWCCRMQLPRASSLRQVVVVVSRSEVCLEPAAASPVHRVYSHNRLRLNQFQDVGCSVPSTPLQGRGWGSGAKVS